VHVRQQFALYGPLSVRHEYFGFIYRQDGIIASAVVRSDTCGKGNCFIETRAAAEQIPSGAKVLGEWHTHPQGGSRVLSIEDVRGARNNRHLRCYAAYYSRPGGEILEWDPAQTSVPTAMASTVSIGNYTDRLASATDEEEAFAL
jgi:hypothetical protein